MNATKIKSLALGLLVALSGLSACISYDNQDQYCDVATSPDNLNDACPYGAPGGAKFAERGGCATITQSADPAKDPACTGALSWQTDVWPSLGGTCAKTPGAGCHADGAKGITLTVADARGAYDTLSRYTGASNRPYIGAGDSQKATQAWILCNVTKGATNGGLTMPPTAGLTGDTLTKVSAWARCGQGF
jgi:hypothetical protein